jgi:hypothetical protein
MMYMLGPIPDGDDHFLHVVEIAGKQVEEYKWRAKDPIFEESKPNKYSTDKSTNKKRK